MMCAALGVPGVIFGQHHAPPATPTAEQSITGDWVIHFQAGHESVSGSLHLQADGERLAGTVETGHTGPGTVENGKWSKQKLEATLVFKKHESVVLEGELKSNGTLAGNYTTEGRTETWQAERKSATALNSSSGVYAQYEALIGTWDVTAPDGGPSFAVQRFTWGAGPLLYMVCGQFHRAGWQGRSALRRNVGLEWCPQEPRYAPHHGSEIGSSAGARNLQRCSGRNDRA